MTRDDMYRELAKARETLRQCCDYLEHCNEANAVLHCAETVMYSPLAAKAAAVVAGLDLAMERLRDGEPLASDDEGVPT